MTVWHSVRFRGCTKASHQCKLCGKPCARSGRHPVMGCEPRKPEMGDRVVFSNSPRRDLRTVVYEITELDESSVTIKLIDEPVLCQSNEPHEHVHMMPRKTAEELGMQLAPEQNGGS